MEETGSVRGHRRFASKQDKVNNLTKQKSFHVFSLICFTNCIVIHLFYKHHTNEQGILGEFEELVLTIVGILGQESYGNSIVEEIKRLVGRDSNLSAVHITLYRLEDKGYVKSKMGGATNERGGRRKRFFTITSAGVSLLRAMKESRTDLWALMPQLNVAKR